MDGYPRLLFSLIFVSRDILDDPARRNVKTETKVYKKAQVPSNFLPSFPPSFFLSFCFFNSGNIG